mgnify:CR=1 FL=1
MQKEWERNFSAHQKMTKGHADLKFFMNHFIFFQTFYKSLGSELEARNQLLLSIGYQPVSKAEELETVPMVKAQLLTDGLKNDADQRTRRP